MNDEMIVMIADMADRIEELEAKLAKAMEALGDATQILSQCTWATMYVQGQYVGRKELVESYRTTLAELTGGKDDL